MMRPNLVASQASQANVPLPPHGRCAVQDRSNSLVSLALPRFRDMVSSQPSPRFLVILPHLPFPTDSQSGFSFRINPPPPPLRVSQSYRCFFQDFVISLRIRTLPFLATSPRPSISLDFVDLTESRQSAACPSAQILLLTRTPSSPPPCILVSFTSIFTSSVDIFGNCAYL